MNIELWYIGKTNEKYIINGMDIFRKRLKHYCKFKEVLLKDIKQFQDANDLKEKEGQMVLSKINDNDYLVLLDENGALPSSVQFSKKIEKMMMSGSKRVVFLIAGAFGASDTLKVRSNYQLSMSKMTFSHQMIRLFFLEQLYRAFTIIRNEKYHNE